MLKEIEMQGKILDGSTMIIPYTYYYIGTTSMVMCCESVCMSKYVGNVSFSSALAADL